MDNQTSTIIHGRNEPRLHKSQSIESQDLFIPPNRVHVKQTIHTFISEDPSSMDVNNPHGY